MKVFMVIVLIFPVVYCDWSQEPKEVNYSYKRTECKLFNPKFIANIYCNHTFRSRFRKYSSFGFTVRPGLKLDKIFLELSTYKMFRTVYRPTLIKVKENFCDIVGNKSHSYLAKEMRKRIATYITNLNEPCPFQGKKYKRDNQQLNETDGPDALPPLIPIGDWKFVYNFTTVMNGPEEFILQFADVYEVTQKSATQF